MAVAMSDDPSPEEIQAFKDRVRWSKYPKLAAIFENRPAVNVYWQELVRLIRDNDR
jgi:hypothetical protein